VRRAQLGAPLLGREAAVLDDPARPARRARCQARQPADGFAAAAAAATALGDDRVWRCGVDGEMLTAFAEATTV
jgi:hypothetical protein